MANAPTRKTTEHDLNQFNIWMRSQPWYQEWHKQRGLDPSGFNNRKLSRAEQSQLEGLMQANGVPLDGGMHIDSGGSANQKNRLVRNSAVVAAAAAVAAGTAGIGPLGFLGGASAVPNAVPAVAGNLAPVLPATPAALSATGTAAAVGGAGGTIKKVADAVTGGGSTMDKIGNILRGGAGAVGAATEAAAQRRASESDDRVRAQALNIQGENAFQSQQLAQAREEAAQRDEARKNLYRASIMKNPQTSVENPRGAPTFSPEMMEGLTNLEKQALQRTSEGPQYKTSQMRGPQFTPIDPQQVARTSRPGTMETVGNWLAPALSLTDLFTDVF